MEKIGFKNGEILTEEKLKEFENGIVHHIRAVASSMTGRVKTGLNLAYLAHENKIEVKSGYGYSPGGELYNLETTTLLDCKKTQNGYILLSFTNEISFRETQIKDDPYIDLVNFSNELIIGMMLNTELSELNRDYHMPQIPIGALLLHEGPEFKDFTTLRGCKAAPELYEHFLKFSGTAFQKESKSIVMLNEEQIPSFAVSGIAERAGAHTHYYEQDAGRGTMWDDVKANWAGKQWTQTSYNGNHEHSANAKFRGLSVPFSLEPDYAKLLVVIRIY